MLGGLASGTASGCNSLRSSVQSICNRVLFPKKLCRRGCTHGRLCSSLRSQRRKPEAPASGQCVPSPRHIQQRFGVRAQRFLHLFLKSTAVCSRCRGVQQVRAAWRCGDGAGAQGRKPLATSGSLVLEQASLSDTRAMDKLRCPHRDDKKQPQLVCGWRQWSNELYVNMHVRKRAGGEGA